MTMESPPQAKSDQSRTRTLVAVCLVLIGAAIVALVSGVLPEPVVAAPPTPAGIVPVTGDVTYGLYLPQILSTTESGRAAGCPATSTAVFGSVPVAGPPTDRPPLVHADLNLSVRGYSRVTEPLTLIDLGGDTDPDAPQLAHITDGNGLPSFVAAYQVNGWDWSCQGDRNKPWAGHGCRAGPITDPPVTLLALAAQRGAPVRTPARNAEIHAGGYVALVLYAEERRLTMVYTREDTAAHGYVIHVEDICVDPALLADYRRLDRAGRSHLPALHGHEQLGTASNRALKVAVRDTGTFLDPRSRKDWWKGY